MRAFSRHAILRWSLIGVICLFPLTTRATFTGPDRLPAHAGGAGQRFINLHSSWVLDKLQYLIGIHSQVIPGPWDYNPATQEFIKLSNNVVSADVFVSLGLFDGFQLGLSIPTLVNAPNQNAATSVLDLRPGPLMIQLNGKVALIRPTKAGDFFGMAFVHSLNAPIDNGGPRLGSYVPIFNLELAMDWDLGPWLMGLNIGYRFRSPIDPNAPARYILDDQLLLSAGIHYYFSQLNLTAIFEINTSTSTVHPYRDEFHSPQELFFGLSQTLPKDITFYAGVGLGATRAIGLARSRIAFGLSWAIEPYRLRPHEEAAHRNALDASLSKGLKEKMTTVKYTLPSTMIKFRANETALRSEHQGLLSAVVTTLKEYPQVHHILIRAHTDNLGPAEKNVRHSQQRAASIKDYFSVHGFPESHIHIEGIGEAEPVKSNEIFQGRIENRRIEIIFTLEETTTPNTDIKDESKPHAPVP